MVTYRTFSYALLAASNVAAFPFTKRAEPTSGFVNQAVCGGKTYTYRALTGYGFVPSNGRDKFGDTVSTGSSIKISGWTYDKSTGSYSGTLWGLPDRGWNVEGTTNFQPRVHKYTFNFTPKPSSATPNLVFDYLDTILLTDPNGNPMTGLDPNTVVKINGFPDMPATTFPGDGWGGEGPGGTRICLDSEALVLSRDGGFWISDEYGPYIYSFAPDGKLRKTISPPNALLPLRNGQVNFASDNPPIYNPSLHPSPVNPTQGRSNNQGIEGMTASFDGRNLYALLQSAGTQEGGLDKTTNRNARFLKYDISGADPRFAGEWVVPLPQFHDPNKSAKNNPRTAAQSEIHWVNDEQFLIIARDSNYGNGGSDGTLSYYRHVDLFDINSATNIKGKFDNFNDSITVNASTKALKDGITPAEYCSFIDVNLSDELAKFGLHNGGARDDGLLNEKWEGLALVPADGADGDDDEWFLFVASDNDFITQDGYANGGAITFSDANGWNLNNQVLVFKIKLPDHSRPFARSGAGKGGLAVP
ncbi:hypothetical protein H072_10638 [Dactylellina haptotyla CBS 200.50]|uniref:Phytase-like domain-containing protein n=1 Tax=Dactylellina haptotyla (strain CBS 200.50) TaxID=1284197 RepID=S8BKZ3_DACHA|nr:hypothetical protein H072_10638 [Dactylellina haptotyla CBS 200.50]